jgi:hypothetical protein
MTAPLKTEQLHAARLRSRRRNAKTRQRNSNQKFWQQRQYHRHPPLLGKGSSRTAATHLSEHLRPSRVPRSVSHCIARLRESRLILNFWRSGYSLLYLGSNACQSL